MRSECVLLTFQFKQKEIAIKSDDYIIHAMQRYYQDFSQVETNYIKRLNCDDQTFAILKCSVCTVPSFPGLFDLSKHNLLILTKVNPLLTRGPRASNRSHPARAAVIGSWIPLYPLFFFRRMKLSNIFKVYLSQFSSCFDEFHHENGPLLI